MKSKDVQGIKLTELGDAIVPGLREYTNRSHGKVEFDIPTASTFELTPDKPYAARSDSTVLHMGSEVGKIVTIAFKAGDGTGDPDSLDYRVQVARETYLRVAQAAPRKKDGIFAEAILPLVQYSFEKLDPITCGGNYSILGLDPRGHITEIAAINAHLPSPGWPTADAVPYLTCGNPDSLKGKDSDKRFGDPHAVYAKFNGPVEIAAFLAVDQEHIGVLIDLGTESNLKLPK